MEQTKSRLRSKSNSIFRSKRRNDSISGLPFVIGAGHQPQVHIPSANPSSDSQDPSSPIPTTATSSTFPPLPPLPDPLTIDTLSIPSPNLSLPANFALPRSPATPASSTFASSRDPWPSRLKTQPSYPDLKGTAWLVTPEPPYSKTSPSSDSTPNLTPELSSNPTHSPLPPTHFETSPYSATSSTFSVPPSPALPNSKSQKGMTLAVRRLQKKKHKNENHENSSHESLATGGGSSPLLAQGSTFGPTGGGILRNMPSQSRLRPTTSSTSISNTHSGSQRPSSSGRSLSKEQLSDTSHDRDRAAEHEYAQIMQSPTGILYNPDSNPLSSFGINTTAANMNAPHSAKSAPGTPIWRPNTGNTTPQTPGLPPTPGMAPFSLSRTLSGKASAKVVSAAERLSNGAPLPTAAQLEHLRNSGGNHGDLSEVTINFGMNASLGATAPINAPGQFNPISAYQNFVSLSERRIEVLRYLQKTHDGRMFWLNSVLFSRDELYSMPSFESKRLGKRAANYLLLGISIPPLLESLANRAEDFLKALSALFSEFESFQQLHPADGQSSLSRARIPHIFKRSGTGKSRRNVSGNEQARGAVSGDNDDKSPSSASGGQIPAGLGLSEQELLPGEEYTYLQTPSLPFDPDFFEVFDILCDVLLDCYQKLKELIPSPAVCSPVVSETFRKMDARLKKIIMIGIVKDFDEAGKASAKSEIAGLNRLVLGGLF